MIGLFGGGLEADGATCTEAVAPGVARALGEAPPRDAPPVDVAGVALVAFDADGDARVRFARDVSGAPPASARAGRGPEALAALAKLGRALAAVHAAGACHGELTGDAVRVAPDGSVALLWCARALPPGALLAARLRAGASPAIVAYAAPEVVTGRAPTPASDVYGLAALAYEAVSGAAPVGQIDLRAAKLGPLAALAAVVERGLAAAPEARPALAELADALAAAADPARAPAAPAIAPAIAPAKAQSMSGILAVLLALGGLCVFTGALWLVTVTWTALDGAGRLLLLCALTAALATAALTLARRGFGRSAIALGVLSLELGWVDGGYALDLAHVEGSGAWTLFAAVMTAAAFGLAVGLDAVAFAVAAGLHFPVFEVFLGAWLRTGAPTGPATFSLAMAALAAALAAAGHRLRGPKLGLAFAVHAGLAALGSAYAGLALLFDADHRAFGTLWPYLVVAASAAAALRLRPPYVALAAGAAGLLVATVPTAGAVVPDLSVAYLLATVAIGVGVVGAALAWPRLSSDGGAQTGAVVVGAIAALAAPAVLFLSKCLDRDGLDALRSERGVYLGVLVLASAALVAVSLALGKNARSKGVYRLVELAALGALFGPFTLASADRGKDLFYPGAILALGVACLAIGARTRRAALVVLAAATLAIQVCVQYFARLWDVFPASLLLLVFGLFLLAGGVLYERTIKRFLPELRGWG